MEQVQQEKQQANHPRSFRDLVDFAITFGGIPALVLNVIFWSVATAFPHLGVVPSILALLITLLLALIAIILLVRYIDITVTLFRDDDTSDNALFALGSGALCLYLSISVVGCLSTAGSLESWHYGLIAVEILLVAYQTWRMFLSNRQ